MAGDTQDDYLPRLPQVSEWHEMSLAQASWRECKSFWFMILLLSMQDSFNYMWWPLTFSIATSTECLLWIFQNSSLMANKALRPFPPSGAQRTLFLLAVDNWSLGLMFPNPFTFHIQLFPSLFQLLVIHTLG